MLFDARKQSLNVIPELLLATPEVLAKCNVLRSTTIQLPRPDVDDGHCSVGCGKSSEVSAGREVIADVPGHSLERTPATGAHSVTSIEMREPTPRCRVDPLTLDPKRGVHCCFIDALDFDDFVAGTLATNNHHARDSGRPRVLQSGDTAAGSPAPQATAPPRARPSTPSRTALNSSRRARACRRIEILALVMHPIIALGCRSRRPGARRAAGPGAARRLSLERSQ